MESTSEIKKETDFEDKYFKISHSIIFAVIIALNALILTLLLMVWLRIIPIFQSPVGIIRFLSFLLGISPIIKIVFASIEIVRFVLFLKSDKRDKEGANKVARGFVGTRIVRNYYIVIIIILAVISEIFQFIGRIVGFPGDVEFLPFYSWFTILLSIDIFLTTVGPHLVKFSIDYTDKEKKTKVIVWSIVWIIVLIFIFNLDYLMPYFD